MRMPLLDRKARDSTALPTMKCAQCNQDVHIRLIGQHQCAQQPAVPSLPAGTQSHGLSSFFDASEDSSRATGPVSRYGAGHGAMDARRAVESRMFPSTYKPSLQILDDDLSANADDDFDFDSMLQNASGHPPTSAGSDRAAEGVGPRKMPEFGHSSSSLSIDSYAAGLSPLDFSQIAGHTSPTANGFTLQHEGSSKANSSRLEQAREELRSALPSPSPSMGGDRSMGTSPRSPEYGHPSSPEYSHPSSSASHPPANVAALQSSLMQQMASGSIPMPAPRPPQQSLPYVPHGDSRSPLTAGTESMMTLSSASQPASPASANGGGAMVSPPPLVRSWHRQNSDNSGLGDNGHNETVPRTGSSHQRQQSAASPIDNNGQQQAVNPDSRSTLASLAGKTDSGSLRIGNMMRPPPVPTQRKVSGNESSRQGPPKLPDEGRFEGNSSFSGSSNGVGETMRAQTQHPSQPLPPPPVSIDTRICISARKPSGGGSGSLSASPQLPPSLSKSNSHEAAAQRPGVDIPQARKLTRNPTAPSSMPAKNPLDVLASLMTSKPQVPAIPQINTQTRSQSPKSRAKGASGRPAAARSLKSAKLDSLLDDLMGEMQALSAEVRTESDRESMVSTASVGAAATSPVDQISGVGLAKEHAYRARLDSTVSTASTSSTLSTGGSQKRHLQCATCGTGIANMGRGTVVRSSGLGRGEVPAGVQGVEHQGHVYCVRDYRRQASRVCGGCGQPCESTAPRDAVHALDAWWHRRCFNCQTCHQDFPDKSFYVFENRPYCRYDYHRLNRSLCGGCQEPIEGPCAQVYEGRFHPGCFACAHCACALRDVYYSLDGRFFCEEHVHQHKSHRTANKRQTVFGRI
ncbi:hypothetical protein IW148_002452 [Coemansia sp. RSA 1199]|nr:hypothetical protein IW148_002452 [Coemansia sp. RSA 1199]